MLKSLLLVLVLLLLTLLGLAVLVLDSTPALAPANSTAAVNLGELQFLSAGNDPRRLKDGATGTLVLGEPDLDLLLGFAASRVNEGVGEVSIEGQQALLKASMQLPVSTMRLFLNISTTLQSGDTWPRIVDLKVGSLSIPQWMQALVLSKGQSYIQSRYPELEQLLSAVQEVSLKEQRLQITYRWDPDLMVKVSRRGSELLLSADMRERLAVYAGKLEELTNASEGRRRMSAGTFLSPLFAHALARGGDPVAENQALLLALSLYALQIDPGQLLDHVDAVSLPRIQHELQFYRRKDLAQHFFMAIGLTLGADAGLANNIGLLKEFEDTRGTGSGFSFTDIGADRMGMRFAEFAVASSQSALQLQQRIAGATSEAEYFPDLRKLPEFLSTEEFESRYGAENTPEFAQEIEKIDLLISQLPVFEP